MEIILAVKIQSIHHSGMAFSVAQLIPIVLIVVLLLFKKRVYLHSLDANLFWYAENKFN
jgi:hypothetical protein